jgi:FkbM family methyltransferase
MEFILAVEPDRRNFKKLSAWADTVSTCTVECHQLAVSDGAGEAPFDASGNRNAGLCTGRGDSTVLTSSPDLLLKGRAVDYMKYDVEGAESAALRGSAQTIVTHRPALRISVYHRPEDMYALPLQLFEICPHYDLHLVRARGCPAWDLDLIALPKKV